jgi:nucleoside-diphosphate-sugar epimerase
MRVLVTGASGFIGGLLCAELLRGGHDVAALVRRPGSAPEGVRALVGDLRDAPSLNRAVRAEAPACVFHLAAEIASQRSPQKVYEVNVEGTRRLLDACLGSARAEPGSPAPRVVLSSTVVTGDARGALLTEDAPLPVTTPYGRSKQEAERLLLDSGLPAVIVRPSHVYGPGGWYAEELVARLRQPGRFVVVGSGANLWDVVHVDDVVEALLVAASDAAPGSIYHVVDDHPIAYGDFMALTSELLGVGAPRRIPIALARIAAGSNAVDAVVRSARSSNEKIKRELGWRPRFSAAREGVRDSLARLKLAD